MSTNDASGIKRLFSHSFGQVGTTEYLSFVLRPNSDRPAGRPFYYGGLSFLPADGVSQDLFIGGTGGNYTVEISGGSGRYYSGVKETLDTPVLLVAGMQFLPGGSHISLYVDPNPSQPLPAVPNAEKDDFAVPITSGVFFNTGGGYTLDEIRLGKSFGSVVPLAVPEPGVAALFAGLSLLSGRLLLHRRRAR